MNWSWFLFSISGRISRKPYWMFLLVMLAVLMVVEILTGDIDTDDISGATTLVSLLSIWPAIAVQAKRWHDMDRSAWWLLINLVPFIGGLVVLIMCGFIRGTQGANRFGPDPLGNETVAADIPRSN